MSADPYSVARLRRSTVTFLATKGVTAPLNLLLFLLISTRLSKTDFALYAWLLAFGQFAEWISYAGLNWLAVHYVPFFRSRIGGRAYVRFVWTLVAARAALLVVLVVVCFGVAPGLLALFGQPSWNHALRLFLAVMFAELGVKFVRLSVLEPLLEQGMSQRNVLLQHVVALTVLLTLWPHGSWSIDQVLYARIASTWSAVAVALIQLAWLLREPAPATSGAQPPDAQTLRRFALDNYVQDLFRILSDGPMVTLLASRLVGVAALALFGFAGNLSDFLYRALPTTLFLGLLRPRLIAGYGQDGVFERLRDRVALLVKLAMTPLAMAAAVLFAAGRPALTLWAHGKYLDSYGLLFCFLVMVGCNALRSLQAMLANVLGHSRFLRRAAISSLIVVPAAVALVGLGAGPYGLVLGLILGEALSAWLVRRQLVRHGYRLPIDRRGYLRLACAAAAGAIVGRAAAAMLPAGWWLVGLEGALTVAAFACTLRLVRAFAPGERAVIEGVVGRRLGFL